MLQTALLAHILFARREAVICLLRQDIIGAQDSFDLYETFADFAITREEADALLLLEKSGKIRECPQWQNFFVTALVDHAVWQSSPCGMVNDDMAEWLVACFDAAPSLARAAVLVAVFEEAVRMPSWFKAAIKPRAELAMKRQHFVPSVVHLDHAGGHSNKASQAAIKLPVSGQKHLTLVA